MYTRMKPCSNDIFSADGLVFLMDYVACTLVKQFA